MTDYSFKKHLPQQRFYVILHIELFIFEYIYYTFVIIMRGSIRRYFPFLSNTTNTHL